MLIVAPRSVNDVSYVTRINHENHFMWQVQHLVKFGMIAGAGHVVIFMKSFPGVCDK